MEDVLLKIIQHTKTEGPVGPKLLERYIRTYNKERPANTKPCAKRELLARFLTSQRQQDDIWRSWDLSEDEAINVLQTLRMKPRRTSSGVATITVITKPWTCSSNCLYCPNDVRMPKSYLFDEPACQRAEHNFFDPYLQVASRLTMLSNMGHVTDKVEIIVLGGTWSDYPESYQTWYIKEIFRALNDSFQERAKNYEKRYGFYVECGLTCDPEVRAQLAKHDQMLVDAGKESFNQAIWNLYRKSRPWIQASKAQQADLDQLFFEHRRNETAANRVVGLVVETQPDAIDLQAVRRLRRLGCTKVQIGIQSLNQDVLDANRRKITIAEIQNAFRLLRLHGFKIHAHFMANLYRSNPQRDKDDYRKFVTDPAYEPDEIKLYPCALVEGTELTRYFQEGTWQPYTEPELVDVLVADTLATPCYVRISRMIREFASRNIVEGNKKVNLRELVEQEARRQHRQIGEIRYREIVNKVIDPETLKLDICSYETSVSQERFLQWVTPDYQIAGFLRLSLPDRRWVEGHAGELSTGPEEAMIREIHIYGAVAKLGGSSKSAQHLGLGKKLMVQAARMAQEAGYAKLNVISSVGTREYYRSCGFEDKELYQQLDIEGLSEEELCQKIYHGSQNI